MSRNFQFYETGKRATFHCGLVRLQACSHCLSEFRTLSRQGSGSGDFLCDKTKASGVNRNYWSGTTVSNNTGNAWNTNLSNGNTNNNGKTNTNYVRCVRFSLGNGKSFVFSAHLRGG
ncbi:MAG: hypothetical protein PHI66_03775 [Candidatus Pacebacteria bacterium]|nr:hypothetical protein [Candidatus Paceibacterota bacterium]